MFKRQIFFSHRKKNEKYKPREKYQIKGARSYLIFLKFAQKKLFMSYRTFHLIKLVFKN